MTDTTQAQQITFGGSLMFYKQPEALNRVSHADLGLKRMEERPFAFVAETHLLPLLLPEFNQAALSYPIIFMGEPRSPAVVMGISAGENLFVTRDKGFNSDAYIPLYVRRYPFALAHDHDNQQAVVVIDRASEMVGENTDVPFFQNGEQTPFLVDMIKYCENFEQSRLTTVAFCELLEQLDLFEVRYTDYTPRNPDGTAGAPQRVAEFFAVSEEKLNALPSDKLVELRDNGALRQIYAHLMSLAGWEKLMSMALSQARERGQPAAANA